MAFVTVHSSNPQIIYYLHVGYHGFLAYIFIVLKPPRFVKKSVIELHV